MKLRNITMIVLSAALVSSCGLYKKYERPAEVKTDGIYGNAQNGDSLGLGDLEWKQVFTDPTLQSLIQKTLDNNVNMQQADLAIQQAEAALHCAKLAYIPSITFSPSGRISKIIDYKQGNSKIYELPLAASWQIGSIGSLRNNKLKAEVGLEQTMVMKQAIQVQLIATVATLYYNLSMLDENLAISEKTLENWKKTLQVTEAYMQAGGANRAGVASTAANVSSIQANIVDLKSSIRQLENTLSAMMGEHPGHISRGALSSFRAPSIITTGVPASILSRRPDVKQAELALASSFYDVNIAKSNFYPALNLTGSLNWTNSLGGAIVNPGKLITAGIASITQPIFRNGALRAQLKVSELEVQSKTLAFQQALIDAGKEVNDAMASIQEAEQKKPFLNAQVASLSEAVEATQALWSTNGSASYLQILTAQTSLLNAQMGEVSNRMASITGTISLYQALGGGFQCEYPKEK